MIVSRTYGMCILLQWKPLNVITLVQHQIDNINRMITIAELADNISTVIFPELIIFVGNAKFGHF
jgi:hypothetical protein